MKLAVLALLGLTALAFGQLHPAAPMPTGTNVLFGRVVDTATDAPVAGAIVTLTGYFEADGRAAATLPPRPGSSLESAPRHVLATADGSFVFRNLPPGRYALAVTAFGYAANTYPLHVVEVSESARPASITMHVWKHGSISGTVVDQRGEPVAGVPVTALKRAVVSGGVALREEWDPVLTDDRGEYRIAPLPPGRYVVGVLWTTTSLPAGIAGEVGTRARPGSAFRELLKAGILPEDGDGVRLGSAVLQQAGPATPIAPDGRLMMYANTFAPGSVSVAEASVVALGSGEARAGVDVAMRFLAGVRVSGVLTNPGGSPA